MLLAADFHQLQQPPATAASAARGNRLPAVVINDNRQPAGTLANGVLTLELRASVGLWRPEADAGPALAVEAFGEGPSPLSVPAPLVRVPEGTEIAARVRDELESPMRVHGLCERGGWPACLPVEVPAGESLQFDSRPVRPGPITTGRRRPACRSRFAPWGPRSSRVRSSWTRLGDHSDYERIFVITDWTALTLGQLKQIASATDPGVAFLALNPKFTFLMNGLSWPHSERLTYHLSEKVRWRVLNLSTQAHTMHMHGFYFEVDSIGDGLSEQTFAPGQKDQVVTQLMQPGSTMAMTWTPERVGNWLFHCHIKAHVSPELRLGAPAPHAGHHAGHDASAGMAGMILGVTVLGPEETTAEHANRESTSARKMTLEMQAEPKRFGDVPEKGFVLTEHKGTRCRTIVCSCPRTDARPEAWRACRDHAGESLAGGHRDPLARHGARERVRRRCMAGAERASARAAHRARRFLRRRVHAAARGHVHVSHAPHDNRS